MTFPITTQSCCFTHLADWTATINAAWKRRWGPTTNPGFCFRGADNSSFDLNPSLLRQPYPTDLAALAICENNLWTEFRLRSRPLLGRQVRDAWEALLIMQQHGFPTRLLDWTRSLAVAAHFAVRDLDSSADGAIWMMAGIHLMELRGSRGAWRTAIGDPALDPMALRENADDLDAFCRQLPVPLSPDHLVPRIAAQRSVYTLHSFARDALERLAESDLKQHGDACFLHKITIPVSCKGAFRHELPVVAGVSEETLFPDLDGFARDFAAEWKTISAESSEDRPHPQHLFEHPPVRHRFPAPSRTRRSASDRNGPEREET